MDEELLKLQQQFLQVQLQEAKHHLSERNCVEIILQLREKKKVDLIFTTSGKEYLTPKQLREEIEDEILAHGGRIGVVDLQPLINVDVSHIEDRVQSLVKHDRKLRLVNGQIITDYFLDSVVEEVNETLQDAGQVAVTTLAQRFALPAELMNECIMSRLGTLLYGQLKDGILFTDTFVQQHKARVRGAFAAITSPTSLRSVVTHHKFLESLAYSQVAQAVDDGELPGTIKGIESRGTYIPNVFAQNQRASVESFYTQNGFIESSILSQLQVAKPAEYMKQHFPDTLKLKSCFLNPLRLSIVAGSIEEAGVNGQWLNIEPLLPPPLTEDDIKLVSSKAVKQANSNLDKENVVFAKGAKYVVSQRFLDECSEKLKPLAKSLAAKTDCSNAGAGPMQAAIEPLPSPAASPRNSPRRSHEEPSGKGRGKGKKKRKGKGKRADFSSDDEEEVVPEPTKKGKRSKKKRGKRRDGDEEKSTLQSPSSKKSTKSAPPEPTLTLPTVISALEKEYSDVDEDLRVEIARAIKPALLEAFQEARKSIFSGGASDRRKRHEANTKTLQELCDHIDLFSSAIASVDAGEDEDGEEDKEEADFSEVTNCQTKKALAALLHKHLLKTVCVSALDVILLNEVMHNHMTEFLPKEGQDTPPQLTWNDRNRIITQLAPQRRQPLDALLKSLSATTSHAFIENLHSTLTACDIRVKRLDKKKERNLIFNMRRGLMAGLETLEQHYLTLQHTVLILYSQAFNVIVHAPSRAIPTLVFLLKPIVPEETYKQLLEANNIIQDQLAQLLTGDNGESENNEEDGEKAMDNSEASAELFEAVRQFGLQPKKQVKSAK